MVNLGEVAESCLPAGRGRKHYMYFVYILQSFKDQGLYIGKTNDIKRRLSEHNYGQVSSTKARKPFKVLEIITCATEEEARELEKSLKKGYKREEIKRKFNL